MSRAVLCVSCAVLLAACEPSDDISSLPSPNRKGTVSLEETLAGRRSVRSYARGTLSPAQIGQLLWSAQGVRDASGRRTAPSAGALYPLEVYVATARGVFRYQPRGHRLLRLSQRDVRGALSRAALSQGAVRQAPAVFVIAAVEARTRRKYGGRARRYVHLEAGHAAQNLLLQATALGLGGVPIGAFSDMQVQTALGCPRSHEPLYLLPVGHPR